MHIHKYISTYTHILERDTHIYIYTYTYLNICKCMCTTCPWRKNHIAHSPLSVLPIAERKGVHVEQHLRTAEKLRSQLFHIGHGYVAALPGRWSREQYSGYRQQVQTAGTAGTDDIDSEYR
jgi:hypothetical protein